MGTRKTLENMQTAIDNAYDSIEEMGGDVPQARNLVNLSGTIDDLQNSVIAGVRGTNDAYQSTGKSYTKGESCIYNNVVYTAKDAISAPAGEFDPSKWDESSLASLRSSISDISASVNTLNNVKVNTATTESNGAAASDEVIFNGIPSYGTAILISCSYSSPVDVTQNASICLLMWENNTDIGYKVIASGVSIHNINSVSISGNRITIKYAGSTYRICKLFILSNRYT